VKYCLFLLSMSFAMTTLLEADDSPPFKPVVEAFAAEKYTQRLLPDGRLREFSIGDVLLMPSHEWIIFLVEGHHSFDRAEPVAVGAYHVPSGRMRQLVFSSLTKEAKFGMTVEAIMPLERNRCGIVTGLDSPTAVNGLPKKKQIYGSVAFEKAKKESPNRFREKALLWEWDLVTDKVRFVGPWESAMTKIAGSLRLGHCEVCWRGLPGANMRGVLELRDRSSGKTAEISLKVGIGNLETDGVTCAPTSRPYAFAVCDASEIDKRRLEVRCVDPNAPDGVRWNLTTMPIESAIGPGILGAAFLQDIEPSVRPLPLFVQRAVKNQCSTYLLFLDQETGKVVGQHRLPFDILYPSLPIISPDYKRVVFADSGLSVKGKPPAMAEDVLSADFYLRFRVIDLGSEKFRDTENLDDKVQMCWLRGFLDNDRAVLSDEHAVWILDTGRNLRLREVFRLNDSKHSGGGKGVRNEWHLGTE
jgi:hypothetical protein